MMVKSSNNTDYRFIKHRIKAFNEKRKSATRNSNKVRLTLDPK